MKLAKHNDGPEIFFTLQGEGKNMGKPSIFIRTSLCNLHCIWCDTPYTWNWDSTPFEHEKGKKYSKKDEIVALKTEQIASIVMQYDCKHVVLTGGEPMMQQKELLELIQELRKMDPAYTFEIETNGTLVPSQNFYASVDQFNVSPKLQNSNNPEKLRLKPKALDFFALSDKSFFKFVVASESDLEEVLSLVNSYNIQPEKVYLMPEGTRNEVLEQRMPMLTAKCMEHGFNLTQRLHIALFGNKRGV